MQEEEAYHNIRRTISSTASREGRFQLQIAIVIQRKAFSHNKTSNIFTNKSKGTVMQS